MEKLSDLQIVDTTRHHCECRCFSCQINHTGWYKQFPRIKGMKKLKAELLKNRENQTQFIPPL